MGRSIVYCDGCGLLLKEEDFNKGKASFQGNRSYCSTCRPVVAAAPPPPPEPAAPSTTRLRPVKVGTQRIPKAASGSGGRMPVVREPIAAAPPPPPRQASNAGLFIGIAIGGVVLLGLLVAALSGGGSRRPPPPAETSVPEPVRRAPPSPPPSTSSSSPGRSKVEAYFEFVRINPADLAGQWKLAHRTMEQLRGTPFAEDLERELADLRRRLSQAQGAVEAEARGPRTEERYKAALDVYRAARNRHDLPEWQGPIDAAIRALENEREGRLQAALEAAVDAKRRNAEPELKSLRERLSKWGMPDVLTKLEAALAAAAPPEPDKPTPPAADPLAAAREAWRARWKAALAAPTPGEAAKALEAAAGDLKDAELKKEAAADLEDLRLAAAFASEAPALASKWTKGQKLALRYRDPSGAWAKHEESLLKADAGRLELKREDFSILIPLGEVGLASFAEAWKSRPGKKESDARAVAAACLLEGDLEGAGTGAEGLPHLKALAAERAAAGISEKEQAARAVFYEAEGLASDRAGGVAAAMKYRSLLSDHGGTAFVARNRAAIAARVDGAKDHLFLQGELAVAGAWKAGKFGKKAEPAWVSEKDLDLAQIKGQYVDLEFGAWADTDYRAWALVGGCCLEVFSFYLQGTGLQGPDAEDPKKLVPMEPGAGAGLSVKLPSLSLKKRHSDHTGPKEPDRFEWISLGTHRWTETGAKKLRLLTNQKGFSVALACVSATRSAPPKDADLKEAERWRAETPGASIRMLPPATGKMHRELYRGISGGLQELLNHSSFKEGKPTEAALVAGIDHVEVGGDDFGSRYRGYVYPPVSGAYVFHLSSDDWAELHLSTDEDPGKKVKIAACTEWTPPRTYTKNAAQTSSPVTLVAGRRYYVEVLQKEAAGGDHVSVAWKLPDGTTQAPIPAERLAPFAAPVK
jgi:hypothetical protein